MDNETFKDTNSSRAGFSGREYRFDRERLDDKTRQILEERARWTVIEWKAYYEQHGAARYINECNEDDES